MKTVLIFVFSLFTLWSCTPQRDNALENWFQPDGKLKVLSTISMIDDLVAQIGGEHIATLTLVKGELDPHSYQLVKGDDEKLARADLVFCNGLGLEHGPSLRDYLSSDPKAICLGDRIREKHPDQILYIQKTPDPHLWMDISLWSKCIPLIAEALAAKDPAHAEIYKERADQLSRQFANEHSRLQAQMQNVSEEKRYLVTSHDAFNYFARSYLATDDERTQSSWQKRFAAPEGLAPESQLSSSDIRQILNHIKKYSIKVIFPESNVSQSSIQKLLEAGQEEGLQLIIASKPLYGDAMGAKGSEGDTYLKMIRHNVYTISTYLDHAGAEDGAAP